MVRHIGKLEWFNAYLASHAWGQARATKCRTRHFRNRNESENVCDLKQMIRIPDPAGDQQGCPFQAHEGPKDKLRRLYQKISSTMTFGLTWVAIEFWQKSHVIASSWQLLNCNMTAQSTPNDKMNLMTKANTCPWLHVIKTTFCACFFLS